MTHATIRGTGRPKVSFEFIYEIIMRQRLIILVPSQKEWEGSRNACDDEEQA